MYSVLKLQFECHHRLTPSTLKALICSPTLTGLFTPCDKSLSPPLTKPAIWDQHEDKSTLHTVKLSPIYSQLQTSLELPPEESQF